MARRYDRAWEIALSNPHIVIPSEAFSKNEVATPAKKGKAIAKKASYESARFGLLNFKSTDEMRRHRILESWLDAGRIADLVVQPVFILIPPFDHVALGHRVGMTWTADWEYTQLAEPFLRVIEDFKGHTFATWQVRMQVALYHLRDRHVFINKSLTGWYEWRAPREGKKKNVPSNQLDQEPKRRGRKVGKV